MYKFFQGSFFWIPTVLSLVLMGCDGNETERFRERVSLESREAAEAERRYQDERSQEMESDLAQRHRFYQAVSGIYEGVGKGEGQTESQYGVRFIFSASLPPYASDRIRAPEEVISDLNNLYLNVQSVMWSLETEGVRGISWGCVYERVRPDLSRGVIQLMSQECKSSYTIYIVEDSDGLISEEFSQEREAAVEFSRRILENENRSVPFLKGFRQANGANGRILFALKKQ